MIKEYKYLDLFIEMRKHKENLKMVGKLLEITPQSVSAKLAGKHDWTIGEIEILCDHYNKDYYELFKRQ